jgi:hypothetical protein
LFCGALSRPWLGQKLPDCLIEFGGLFNLQPREARPREKSFRIQKKAVKAALPFL